MPASASRRRHVCAHGRGGPQPPVTHTKKRTAIRCIELATGCGPGLGRARPSAPAGPVRAAWVGEVRGLIGTQRAGVCVCTVGACGALKRGVPPFFSLSCAYPDPTKKNVLACPSSARPPQAAWPPGRRHPGHPPPVTRAMTYSWPACVTAAPPPPPPPPPPGHPGATSSSRSALPPHRVPARPASPRPGPARTCTSASSPAPWPPRWTATRNGSPLEKPPSWAPTWPPWPRPRGRPAAWPSWTSGSAPRPTPHTWRPRRAWAG